MKRSWVCVVMCASSQRSSFLSSIPRRYAFNGQRVQIPEGSEEKEEEEEKEQQQVEVRGEAPTPATSLPPRAHSLARSDVRSPRSSAQAG